MFDSLFLAIQDILKEIDDGFNDNLTVRVPGIGQSGYLSMSDNEFCHHLIFIEELIIFIHKCKSSYGLRITIIPCFKNSYLESISEECNLKYKSDLFGIIDENTLLVNAWDSSSFIGNGLRNAQSIEGWLVAGYGYNKELINSSFLHNAWFQELYPRDRWVNKESKESVNVLYEINTYPHQLPVNAAQIVFTHLQAKYPDITTHIKTNIYGSGSCKQLFPQWSVRAHRDLEVDYMLTHDIQFHLKDFVLYKNKTPYSLPDLEPILAEYEKLPNEKNETFHRKSSPLLVLKQYLKQLRDKDIQNILITTPGADVIQLQHNMLLQQSKRNQVSITPNPLFQYDSTEVRLDKILGFYNFKTRILKSAYNFCKTALQKKLQAKVYSARSYTEDDRNH